jgi:hypothetical protein
MNQLDANRLLLPCPFCGGKATALKMRAGTGKLYWTVGCETTLCRGGHSATAGPDLEKEIIAWNKRPAR